MVARLSHAEQSLRRLLKLVPRHPTANEQLAQLCIAKQDWAGAAQCLEVLCSLQPKQAAHWTRLISCLQMAGQPERALAAFEAAASAGIDPPVLESLRHSLSEPPAHRQQALLSQYQSAKDVLTCEIAARLFMADFPNHPLGWLVLGALMHDQQRWAEALELKQYTVKRFPEDPNAWNNLACTQLAMADPEGALDSTQQALNIDPQHAAAQQCRQEAHEAIDA